MYERHRMFVVRAATLLVFAAAILAPNFKPVSAMAGLDTFSVDGITADCDGSGLVSFTGTIPPGGFTLTLMTKAANNSGQFFPAPGVPILAFTSGNSPLGYRFDLTNFVGPHYRVDSNFNTKSPSLSCGNPTASDTPTATDTPAPTNTPTATGTLTATGTAIATNTPTPTNTPTATNSQTVSADTQTPAATNTPTATITNVSRTQTPVPTSPAATTTSNTSTPRAGSTAPAGTTTVLNTVLAAITGPRNGAGGASGLPATGQGQVRGHARYLLVLLAVTIGGLTTVGVVISRRHRV